MTTHHPIAILGAGLGGLAAARVLHVHGIEAAVFDLEADRGARVQGGMLDIHDDSGQLAIRTAGLWDEFAAIIHEGGESMRILDHTGAVLFEHADDGERRRPEVDRGALRDILIDALPDGAIRWGHNAVSISAAGAASAPYAVAFENGETITTDLLIGADGAWSKTRRLLTDAWPEYTGISFVEADLFDAAERHPAEAETMGGGMLFAFRDHTGVLGHAEPDASLHAYVGFRVDEGWVDTIDFTDVAASKQAVLALLDGWGPGLRGLVANADSPLTPRRIHVLPVGVSWQRRPGVTLLGDAAHLMSPFAGEGANLALFDGSELARAIVEHPGDTEAALTAYEAELFPRAAASAGQSAASLDMMFADGSPGPLLGFFRSMGATPPDPA